jgi:hypothetical protein
MTVVPPLLPPDKIEEAGSIGQRPPWELSKIPTRPSKIWSYFLSYKPVAEADTGRHSRRTRSCSAAPSGIRRTRRRELHIFEGTSQIQRLIMVLSGPASRMIGPRLNGAKGSSCGMTLADLNDAEARAEVSPRVPLLMAIRDKLALALREES